jgi:uncharacterized membrane protein
MLNSHPERLQLFVKLLTFALIWKVTSSVVLNYPAYLPPDFGTGFLQGREVYFWHGYHWAFYLHITFGPCALLVGTVLMSQRFRRRYSRWHRYLGRFQMVCVLFAVVPSGIWMAFHADTGPLAGFGFGSLGAATGLTAALGWRAAVNKRWSEHRRWMTRCFLLLCSAVVLRLLGGAFTIAGLEGDWTYMLAAWISWLVPLAAYECIQRGYKSSRHEVELHALPFQHSTIIRSPPANSR